MHVRNEKGQGILMTVLLLGVLMVTIIVFGARRQADISTLVGRLDASQTAYEVLSSATKRVQSIYANESGCDPRILNLRLSRLEKLPTIPAGGLSYVTAQPGLTSGAVERFNLCDPSSTNGCRQLAINLENLVYIVTVGSVVGTDANAMTATTDSPQDVNVRVSVAINGSVFSQWSTLINVCTLGSTYGDSFTGTSAAISGGVTTSACGFLPSRRYGALTDPTGTYVNADDLRWARRYLETGGADIGETTYMINSITDNSNGSCAPPAAGQCFGRNCIPAFDLNRDKTNNEADLGILELYLRGYLLTLPVSYLN